MPRITTTVEIQDGASAFNYQSIKEGWHARRWIKPEQKYRIKRIPSDNSHADKQACSAMFSSVASACP